MYRRARFFKARINLDRHDAAQLAQLAVVDFRAVGHAVYQAMSLNNASNRYSELAGLEETREGRVGQLERAVEAIEEAVRKIGGAGWRERVYGFV